MLIGDVVLQNLRMFRMMWIGGRFGGGKTALAVRLGYEFVKRGWSEHIITNFPCVLATDLHNLPKLHDCFVILDEAGIWMRTRELDEVAAFLRKVNVTMVFPSIFSPPLRARTLEIQRILNLQTAGLPLWVYQLRLDYMRVKENHKLFWLNPQEIYGAWDTNDITVDSRGIVEYIKATFHFTGERDFKVWTQSDERKRHAIEGWADDIRRPTVPSRARDEELAELRRFSEDAYETAQKFDDAVALLKRKSNGR